MDTFCYYAQLAYKKLLHRKLQCKISVNEVSASTSKSTLDENVDRDEGFTKEQKCYLISDCNCDCCWDLKKTGTSISNLPDEILDKFFDTLDVNTLKCCRLVCYNWNSLLSSKKSFLDKLCICHVNLDQSAHQEQEISYCQNKNLPSLQLTALRLRHLYSFWNTLPPNIFKWVHTQTTVNIFWLEIQNSQLKISQLLDIIGELINLKTLCISGDTILHNSTTGFMTSSHIESNFQDLTLRGRKTLKELKHLFLHFDDLHNFLLTLDRLGLIVFKNLQTLDLKGSAGNTTNPFRIGGVLTKIINQNSKTLKIFRLDNFVSNVRGSLDDKLSSSKYLLRASLYTEFQHFLEEIEWIKINISQLEEISFQRFPIANTNESLLLQNFVPFLSNAKNLRKIYFSQLYFSKDLNFETFLVTIPQNVSISMTSVHLHIPNPNLDNITEVIHTEQNILKYQQASVQLNFLNLDWIILYVTWSSLRENLLMQKYSPFLRKLHLNRVLFSIGDEEMQFITKEAKFLEDLSFESCDLSNLTDSGITGLSTIALNKIWTDDTYDPLPTDFISSPIQELKVLQSLKIDQVGGNVTRVSILMSFTQMTQLRSLVIYQNPMVIHSKTIKDLSARRNIAITYQHPNP